MPRQPTVTDISLNNILACLRPAVTLLDQIKDGFGTPFIPAISNTTLSLIAVVENVKRNKDECVQLMEHVHEVIYAIVYLHLKSETGGVLAPVMLKHISQFTETLHRLYTFVTEQQKGSKIRHFFRQSEMSTLLRDCQKGMQQALEAFKINTGFTVFNDIAKMKKISEDIHNELLEQISMLSDGTTSDRSSSMYQLAYGSQNSSNSFSMLPSEPKIFHGREAELNQIVKALNQDSARIAILGAGGMGKTSLARAALHDPGVAKKYELRVFVACDSATTSVELAALIGSHLGLKPEKDLTKSVVLYFSKNKTSLLVLDNLETPWETRESRTQVEEFLSLLTDIPHLALLITIRGAERPAKVQWTRPFLPPLNPLSNNAARQIFTDIADDFHAKEDINRILSLTDNIPLAVDLIAHIVDLEGCTNVLARWEIEKTAMLSEGYDQRSNLNTSIAISLSSPRITASAGATELLSLLSILPDGLSDVELRQVALPINNPLGCRAALLGTALAYSDDKNRLKSLVPIREHIRHFFPPQPYLIRPIRKHFFQLLELYSLGNSQLAGAVKQITSNLGNLHSILRESLHPDDPDIAETVKCTLSFNSFSRITGHGRTALMDHLPATFSQSSDHNLEAHYISEELGSTFYRPFINSEFLISQAISQLASSNDTKLQCNFYSRLGWYYIGQKNNQTTGLQYLEKALALSKLGGDPSQQANALVFLADFKNMIGDHAAAQTQAWEAQRLSKLAAAPHTELRAVTIDASCSMALGNFKASILLLQRVNELRGLCGIKMWSVEDSSNSEAEVHLLKSEYTEAKDIHKRILAANPDKEDMFVCAFPLLNIAEIDVIIGTAPADVHKSLQKATKIFQSVNPLALTYCETILADLNLRDGNAFDAKRQFQQCFSSQWGRDDQVVTYCLERLADICRWSAADFNWTWAVVYLGHSQKLQKKLDLHKALRVLGDIFASEGDEQTAKSLFEVALDGFTYMDVHRSRADCMLRLGDLAQKWGNMARAQKLWKEARPLFERTLQTADVKKVDSRLASTEDILIFHVPMQSLEELSMSVNPDQLQTVT